MKRLSLLFVMLACTAVAFPRSGPRYETDRGTTGFLFYHLLSGGEITYPSDAAWLKLQGSGFFLMRLRPNGVVESLTIKSSTGYAVIDEHVTQTLKAYRFKAGTKGPILWLVGFLQPATVIVHASLVKEPSPPSTPKKK
jgi:TonB family protein